MPTGEHMATVNKVTQRVKRKCNCLNRNQSAVNISNGNSNTKGKKPAYFVLYSKLDETSAEKCNMTVSSEHMYIPPEKLKSRLLWKWRWRLRWRWR